MKNTLLKWILQNISENQTFQRTTKFTMADSYEMDFVKGIVILVKVDEMYKISNHTPFKRSTFISNA